VLGDLPELRNISTLLPGLDVRAIPFPNFAGAAEPRHGSSSEPLYDVVFTGALTDYRSEVLVLLEQAGLSVACPGRFVSRNRRNAMNRSGKVIVNIPQRQGWSWLSPMRIIAGLQTGRATVSLGTQDTSRIASCCTQIDVRDPDWMSQIKHCVDNWRTLYERDLAHYALMARQFERERPFPHDVFEYWSLTDRLRH
jgi:hypothetical protein